MKLPNTEGAIVPSRKITHYLRSTAHRDGQHKAEFFRGFGFKPEAWEKLAAALLDHACLHEVIEIVPTPFGRNFVIEGALAASARRLVYCQKRGNGYISHSVSIGYLTMIEELDSVVLTPTCRSMAWPRTTSARSCLFTRVVKAAPSNS
jgi:hypothetical protein